MWKRRDADIELKTPGQLAAMRAAGLVVANALRAAADAAAPGMSTADLDAVASDTILAAGATSSFKGYHGFPATICTSVNAEIVHGIPNPGKKLREGDVLSIDCGAIVDGWHADAALSIGIGEISAELARLLNACEQALWHGLARARVGGRLTDISHAVEQSVRSAGDYGIVEDYVGHGIGSQMHMDPPVHNQGRPGHGPVLREGMALAVEPLLTAGSPETVLLEDGWTVLSADGGVAAHFEHTIALTADGPWVLTAPDGGRSDFARFATPLAGSLAGPAGCAADSRALNNSAAGNRAAHS
ncbi:MAG TPA: type I methionyl aminopeptidase [Streptosporangiaceae bacterium]|nr:type I methionyl aminopeptidase [Streptosporangiaceae bacterium]